MVFSSTIFLFIFLPVLLMVYFLAKDNYRNVILLVASLFFYAWGEPKTVFLMILSIAVNYAFGFLVNRKWKYNKLFVILSVIYNLGVLFVFKYLTFAVSIFNRLSATPIAFRQIALPIGISFYTFQIMSYVIDVYRGNCKPQKSILNLGLYVSLFPQLIAGPIVRYVDVEKQIMSRTTTVEKASEGFIRFCTGFAKKVLIADQLSTFVGIAFEGSYSSIFIKWVGIIAYTLQIFFDFSGYSDMAIGLGRMFGFHFLENFNFPYISKHLNSLGFDVLYQTTVGDNPERMRRVIEHALERADVVITSGGLGPTRGDITKEVVMDICGLESYLDMTTLCRLYEFLAQKGVEPSENNEKQAYVPVGAEV